MMMMRIVEITLLRVKGKYNDAEVLHKQCLDKRKIVLGESH